MTVNISDRINEAYFNELGASLGEKTRERIHWICSKVFGEKVIDVGCSQGITSVLLAREGLKVLGVDTNQSAIDYANSFINNESDSTKSNVNFVCENFLQNNFEGEKFDTVIATEILEHVTLPRRFIKRFSEIIKPDGKLIITVPFGINNYFDHKKTYYILDIMDELSSFFTIQEYQYLSKWTGFVCSLSKKGDKALQIDRLLLKGLEENFYRIESNYLNNIESCNNNITNLTSKSNKLEQANIQLKSEKAALEQINEELKSGKAALEQINEELKSEKAALEQINEELKSEKAALEQINEELKSGKAALEQINEELKSGKAALEQINEQHKSEKVALEQINEELKSGKAALEQINEQHKSEKVALEQINEVLKSEKATLEQTNEELKSKTATLEQKNQKLSSDLAKKTDYYTAVKKLLETTIKSEVETLKNYKELMAEHERLKKVYNGIKTSKLGRIMSLCWRISNRLRGKK